MSHKEQINVVQHNLTETMSSNELIATIRSTLGFSRVSVETKAKITATHCSFPATAA